MNPIEALDMKHRTGISMEEVDDFASRMDQIAKAMEEIQNGTFDPHKCKIPGYKTPEQEEAERVKKLKLEEERQQREQERKRKEKQDEYDSWWHRARLRFSLDQDEDEDDEKASKFSTKKQSASEKWANRVMAAYKARDANDYSMWDNWEPEDPVSKEEQAEREAQLQKLRNEEFEANNPEFCNQFKEDIAKRQRSQEEKQRAAEKLKRQGNHCYKKKQYEDAIQFYMKALTQTPFNVAVLANIAQCYLRLEALDDCIEFCTRTLYINPNYVKALSRRATAWHRQQKWKAAADDMIKAIQFDPENQDLVEQHSVIVGDYEDSIVQSDLNAKIAVAGSSAGDIVVAEELRFVKGLLAKMNEKVAADSIPSKFEAQETIHDAWGAYEILVPFLERNSDVRALFRTSGEMLRLADRLGAILNDNSLVMIVKSNKGTEIIVSAMIHCIAAAMTNTQRNQVVLFRHTEFRQRIFEALTALVGPNGNQETKEGTQELPWSIQSGIARIFEEAIDSKVWRNAVTTSEGAMNAFIYLLKQPVKGSDRQDVRLAILSTSSICLTISADANGLKELCKRNVDSLISVSLAVCHHSKRKEDMPTLRNLLGVLTNLSTCSTIRSVLEKAEHQSLCARFVHDLLDLVERECCVIDHAPNAYICSERALATLLNLSFHEKSPLRELFVQFALVEKSERIFRCLLARTGAFDKAVLVLSRTMSLLCRLHSVMKVHSADRDCGQTTDAKFATTEARLSHSDVMDLLYNMCQQALISLANSVDSNAHSEDRWQLCAQIWCHVGWCIHHPHVRRYLREKQAIQPMIQSIAHANQFKKYSDSNVRERLVGNIVKALITIQSEHYPNDHAILSHKRTLEILVNTLQALPDGLARKNVAILLARLCQYDPKVKDNVRALRGIEMMLTVSQSLKTSNKTTKHLTDEERKLGAVFG